MKLLIEGINFNQETDSFDFNWKDDSPNDLMGLKLQKYNKYISSKQGFNLYYATYSFTYKCFSHFLYSCKGRIILYYNILYIYSI